MTKRCGPPLVVGARFTLTLIRWALCRGSIGLIDGALGSGASPRAREGETTDGERDARADRGEHVEVERTEAHGSGAGEGDGCPARGIAAVSN